MTQANYILLLGAGFSRNWGGWLASEAFEYLLGCQEIDAGLKDLLWRNKRRGGFEAALAQLLEEHDKAGRKHPEPRLVNFKKAIDRMFADMDQAFGRTQFEFQNHIQFLIRTFLVRFNAIFTLNQDLLLERHYLNDNVCLSSAQRWDGWQVPGMKRVNGPHPPLDNPSLGGWEPDPSSFQVSQRLQPYFKLHGSSNWVTSGSDGLLVLGGNKPSIIRRYPILKWCHEQFKGYLSKPNTRLMVIGYSFGDDHINAVIREAVKANSIELFVIDPLGVDVMDKNRDAVLYDAGELAKDLWPHVIGSSRRSLREIFGFDHAEHSKVMRFFE